MQQGAIRPDCAIAFCRTKCERFLSKRINICAEKINQNSILSYSLHATSKKVGKIQQTKHITKIANASSRPKIAVLFSCQNIHAGMRIHSNTITINYGPIRLLQLSHVQFFNILYFTHYQANKTIFQQRLLIEAECKNLRSKTIHACKIISL